jgi:hypothetical protein
MKSIRFMQNNFLQNGFTYSSQLSDFPASNAINTSRSRVWKPAGNFEVTALNNLIYINDGSNKTITLTVGAYTFDTLATHIQTRLNASSSNWTCAYDSALTYKFTINRTSGTEILRKSQTTNAAWDMLGYTGTNDISSGPFIADEQRNHTSEWLKCDLAVPQLATFGGIISGIDSIFTLSATATVKVLANNIDYWVSPPVEIILTNGKLSSMKMLDDENIATYRFWKLEIIDRLNYLGPQGIEIAFAYVGDHVSMTQTNMATGFSKELTDPSITLQSENGALFSERRPRYLTLKNCQIQLLNGQEREDIEQLFYDIGIREPMFVSVDPDVSVTLALEELTRFMVMTDSPTLEHVLRDYYNVSFAMREAF